MTSPAITQVGGTPSSVAAETPEGRTKSGVVHRGMRVASVCSSVGGLDLGLDRAGHETVFLCEFEPWRRKVLARHWPGVPIHHDLKELRASDIPVCDLFVGGTPCQDLSHAGKRAGLDGERSGLFHAFAQLRLDLFELHGCAWSLWENVAGALSSNDGRDFATVLASHVGADVAVPAGGWPGSGLVSGPWGTAEWRLLDAQFFGVPQRRRRVFVVGHLGAVDPVEVLADTPRGPRDLEAGERSRPRAADRPPPGAGVVGSLTKGGPAQLDDNAIGGGQVVVVAGTMPARKTGGYDVDPSMAADGYLQVASTLTSGSHNGRPPGRRQEDDRNIVTAFHMTQDPITDVVAPSLGATTSGTVGVSFSENQRGELVEAPVAQSLSKPGGKPGQGYPAIRSERGVRRLTPTECERLMGWPDGWTLDAGPSLLGALQGWPGADRSPVDPAPDGRRYSACGDGVVAHVAEWIGLGFAEAVVS